MYSEMFIPLLLAGLCQYWFWSLHLHEQRSLWYGLSFIAAVGTALLAVEVFLYDCLPAASHPVAGAIGATLAVVFLVALLVFPVALVITLIVTGVKLVRREGAGPRNLLSLALGLAMLAYVLVWPKLRSLLVGLPVLGSVLDFVFGFAAILIGIASVAFTLYTVSGLLVQIPHRRRRYGSVVVLGSGLAKDGSVTPLLAHRVERGVEMWRRNPGSLLVMSGGQGPDEARPEAHAMRDYALSLGVPADAVLVEDRSGNTEENLDLSSRVIASWRLKHAGGSRGHGGRGGRRQGSASGEKGAADGGRILVVTDDYHVFRALLISRELGLSADGAGAHVRLYFSLNALVREWVAYVSLRQRFYARLTTALLVIYLAVSLLQAFAPVSS